MYTPEYLKNIQNDIKTMIDHAENALNTIENSKEYTNHLHPFHAAAVATYNRLTTIILTLDRLGV